jgi:hypothetical protein
MRHWSLLITNIATTASYNPIGSLMIFVTVAGAE